MDIEITVSKAIHLQGLSLELTSMSIPNEGVSYTTNLVTLHGIPPANEQQARDVVTLHDASVWLAKEQNWLTRAAAAKGTAKSIPNWAIWTQQDWQTYFNNNLSDTEVDLVTSLGAARVMLKRQNTVINALAKLLIAMRDQLWPDLPE